MGSDEVIVVDTHVLIWYLTGDDRLDPSHRRELQADSGSVLVPTVCYWEIALLAGRGRLELMEGTDLAELIGFVKRAGFRDAPLTAEIAILSRTLPFSHEDPADRFIAATAYALGARLATQDARLRSLPFLTFG
ncbi:MAG: type II toxin-antitoxin system VapC family toxin [Fimbriimonadaceae bacterium]|nr:type II toxin-antitoxin system VapC family toxin [Fimbriimonadaceae bacterium]